ncbi:DNA-binding SARP family transcriptional activator [Nocardia tenerifensis]|uniref:DNA-binding SARP family transcriptional activator n=2 Tax=Nocardia tenerifensis TaxID=228006 RepID=A0A318JLS4_9NOCA|nr:AfsR/SARP family transcriptional regulator [Nocardia tenerifensis]PXX54641.1 DNA-binding SARP family transcriptional activator [Nocardia tenerifensis]
MTAPQGLVDSTRAPEPGCAQVRVLGPVLVTDGTGTLGVDRPLERAMLVRLALAGGIAVPDRRLAADLWGDGDISRPVERLRVVVSRLRTALGVHGRTVLRTPAGYRTTMVVGDLLAAESIADRLQAAQRADRHAEVVAAADEATRLWRGPALADLMWAPYAAVEAARLDAWRLELTVAGLAAALRLGSGLECLREMGILAAEHPAHEPLARLHALALYRAGRQVDALDRLRGLRSTLAEQFGAALGPESVDLEVRILRHDPALHPSVVAGKWSGSTASTAQRITRYRDVAAYAHRFRRVDH